MMTPREKAISIVYGFHNKVSLDISEARRCASLMVLQLIQELNDMPECMVMDRYEYWNEVKKQINNI